MRLPELLVWPSDDSTDPDIELVYERVAPPPVGAPAVHIETSGTVLLAVPNVGRVRVHEGRRISIDPDVSRDDAGLRLYVLGSVFAIVCYQRGLVPFHASALVPDPTLGMRAIMVGGESGAGKSTLAATFALRGAPILADDICVVDVSSPGETLVVPGIPRIKLWQDTLERLDISADVREQVRDGIDKYAWYGAKTCALTPIPLAAIYHLTRSTALAGHAPSRIAGVAAVEALSKCVYRPEIGITLGQELLIASTLMRVLATTPLFAVQRDPDASDPCAVSSVVLAHWRSLLAGSENSTNIAAAFA